MKGFELQFVFPTDQDWQDYIQCQPGVNIFHHPGWMDLLKECYGFGAFIMILRDSGDSICVGLPIMEVNHIFRKQRWVSLPFSDHCAPLSSNPAAVVSLLELLTSFDERPAFPSIEIRWNVFGRDISPDFVLHTLRLDRDFDTVNQGIHHSHSRNVRIARANGIQITHGVGKEELSAFYDLHLQTRHRQGVPIQPRRYFDLLDEILLQQGLGFISLAWRDSTCVAGAVFLHWKDTLTYKYGASTELGLSARANHLLFWDAIRWGCENGYSLLDFGRTDCDNEGLRLFKGRWGAVEVPLYYSTISSQPQQNTSIHKLKNIAQSVIKRSPPWVCRLSGEFLYRFFG